MHLADVSVERSVSKWCPKNIKDLLQGREMKSVAAIICVHVTGKFDSSD